MSLSELLSDVRERIFSHEYMTLETTQELQDISEILWGLAGSTDDLGPIVRSMYSSLLVGQGITEDEVEVYQRVKVLHERNAKLITGARKVHDRVVGEIFTDPVLYKKWCEYASKRKEDLQFFINMKDQDLSYLKIFGEKLSEAQKKYMQRLMDPDFTKKCIIYFEVTKFMSIDLEIPVPQPIRLAWCGNWVLAPAYQDYRRKKVQKYGVHLRKAINVGDSLRKDGMEILGDEQAEILLRTTQLRATMDQVAQLPPRPPTPELTDETGIKKPEGESKGEEESKEQ